MLHSVFCKTYFKRRKSLNLIWWLWNIFIFVWELSNFWFILYNFLILFQPNFSGEMLWLECVILTSSLNNHDEISSGIFLPEKFRDYVNLPRTKTRKCSDWWGDMTCLEMNLMIITRSWVKNRKIIKLSECNEMSER